MKEEDKLVKISGPPDCPPRLINILEEEVTEHLKAHMEDVAAMIADGSIYEMPDNYGALELSHTVWCGRCGTWDQISGKKSYCAKMFKKDGWTTTRIKGWRCPQCSKKDQP